MEGFEGGGEVGDDGGGLVRARMGVEVDVVGSVHSRHGMVFFYSSRETGHRSQVVLAILSYQMINNLFLGVHADRCCC